jgi:2-methylcitrate dehydratase PrpD
MSAEAMAADSTPGAGNRGATAQVARWIRSSRDQPLAEGVRTAARRAFVNWMGCALGAIEDPPVRQVLQAACALSGRSDASVIGSDRSLDPVNAALVNGVAANALDYDDMHAPTLIHPTGPVVAAALALAESRRASGEVLLRAIVAGIEVECRLGLALYPAHYDAGWHITATLGTLGAAAAACVVLDLDDERTRHALGIAATFAGGLRAMLASPCKSLNIGKAAAAGASAALIAQTGFEAEPEALEAKFGFFAVFGEPHRPLQLPLEPGARYLVEKTSLKPYPCGIVIHPLIDACIALARPGVLRAADVRRVRASVHPRAIELAGRPHPANALEGRYSLQHAAALAFARGSAGLSDFDQARVDDPELARWRDRIELTADAAAGLSEARVSLELASGERRSHAVQHPSGSPERPLTDAQLLRKFTELACRAMPAGAAERLYRDGLALDRLDDVNALRRNWQTEGSGA